MSYEYSDTTRESEPHALPDVEIFGDYLNICTGCGRETFEDEAEQECSDCGSAWERTQTEAFWYAFGFPGCLWDGDPVGPFDTYEEALAAAREQVEG